jgi:hypothetical protein
MQSRLEMQKVAPEAYRAMTVPGNYVRNSGLEPKLVKAGSGLPDGSGHLSA